MTINGRTLVQVTNDNTGVVVGLYLVPTENIEAFEVDIQCADDQDEFDENNLVGAERIFADDCILNIQF